MEIALSPIVQPSPAERETRRAGGNGIEPPLAPASPSREADRVAISEAAEKLYLQDQTQGREWRYRRDEDSREMLFQIVDSRDGSVILQIPDEASIRRRSAYEAQSRDHGAACLGFSTRT